MTARVGLYPSSGRGGVLVVVATLAATAVLAIAATRGCDPAAGLLARRFALGCAALAAAALGLLSRRVVADAWGVRRHDLGGTRSAAWDAVIHATFEPAASHRRARVALTTSQGTIFLPADPRLAAVIRARAPRLAPALQAIPPPREAARREMLRGLELWLLALQAAGAASLASSLLPTLEGRLVAGAAVLLAGLGWVLALRRGPWLLRPLDRGHGDPHPALRLLALGGENAGALVLLVLLVNVMVGFLGSAAVPRDPARARVLAGEDVPVRTLQVAGRALALPAALTPGCEVRESGLVCLRDDGWITVDRDESPEGLLGGDMLRRTMLFRRDGLRLDALPHRALAWYAAGMLARLLHDDPPDLLVERPDGEVSVVWRRRDRARALVASGGEMLSVDVRGVAVRDEILLPLLGSIAASGSDLRCRWVRAVTRAAGAPAR